MTKTIIVTGGNSGIGEAIVKKLLNEYYVISIDLQHAANSTERYHKKIKADVSNEKQVQNIFKELFKDGLEVFALINNAGISYKSSFLNHTTDNWKRTLEINLIAPFLMSREFTNEFRPSKDALGKIINIASVSGMVGMPNYCAYNSSKAGLIELTKTMSLELAPSIHTCAICPGYILTPMQAQEYTDDELESCANDNPSKRLGTPDEVAELVSFILTNKNNYLNGSILVMDGGETSGSRCFNLSRFK